MPSKNEAPAPAENYVHFWRSRKHVSLNKLSTLIAGQGQQFVSAKTLNRWEKGETPLPSWAIPELAKALRISETDLLYGPREADPTLPGQRVSRLHGARPRDRRACH